MLKRILLPHWQSGAAALLALLLCAAPASQAAPQPAAHKAKAGHKAKTKAVKKAPATDYEGEFADFNSWTEVSSFLDELARKQGTDRAALTALMAQVRYVDAAVQLIKPAPPGKPKNWQAYSARFIEPLRINAGVAFWNANQDTLARAEAQYGVPAEIIVGILGVETIYGRNTGRFRVLDALTTLAFAYPETPTRLQRMAFFREELAATLQFARQNGIDPLSLRGSYAGAIGMPQFMPSSILRNAVDFDGNGKIELLESPADAIGSVAAFLTGHGWQRDEAGPLVYSATVSPARAWEQLIDRGLSATLMPLELKVAGVSTTATLPANMLFGLIDLQNGAEATEYWVAAPNFFAITQYNRSYFYAMSVIELGRAIKLSRSEQM